MFESWLIYQNLFKSRYLLASIWLAGSLALFLFFPPKKFLMLDVVDWAYYWFFPVLFSLSSALCLISASSAPSVYFFRKSTRISS